MCCFGSKDSDEHEMPLYSRRNIAFMTDEERDSLTSGRATPPGRAPWEMLPCTPPRTPSPPAPPRSYSPDSRFPTIPRTPSPVAFPGPPRPVLASAHLPLDQSSTDIY